MKTAQLFCMLIGCIMGFVPVYAALADLQQSSGPLHVSYEITAITTVPGSGKIILAGFYKNIRGRRQLFIARENATGTGLDATFGTCYTPPASGAIALNGYTVIGNDVFSTLSATVDWVPSAIMIDDVGNIVIVGTAQDQNVPAAPQEGFIVRLTSAGALDTTFGSVDIPTQGYNLFSASDLGLPISPTVTPVAFNTVKQHNTVDGGGINRYVILGTGTPQGIVVAVQTGGATDGQLDFTFNGNGVFGFAGDALGATATDSVMLNDIQIANDTAGNTNYYIAGSVKISGILIALQIISAAAPGVQTIQLQTATFGPAGVTAGTKLGYFSVPGNILGGTISSSVVFNKVIQNATGVLDWYVIGQMNEDQAFLAAILRDGSGINQSFNFTAATLQSFGSVPGVVTFPSSSIGQVGSMQFSSLIQKAGPDFNFYIAGIAGQSVFFVSITTAGTAFNPAFGVAGSGYITLSTTTVGLLEAPNIAQGFWDSVGSRLYLLSSDTSPSSPGVASSVAKILANGSALDVATYNAAGTVPGVSAPFTFTFNYLRNYVIQTNNVNTHIAVLQCAVGQMVQVLAPTDNPLQPPITQQLIVPNTVFDVLDAIYSADEEKIVVVGTQYVINAGNGLTTGYIARFNSDLTLDTTFGLPAPLPATDSLGYKNFAADSFGGVATNPALFFSVVSPDVNGNYTVVGSVNIAGVYQALIAQILNEGTAIAAATSTFNNPTGYQTYTSAALGGAANNAVLTGILKNTNLYVIGMTDVVAAIAVPSIDSATAVNVGNGIIANINATTGVVTTTLAITPVSFGCNVGVHTQLCGIVQKTDTFNFVVAANLPNTVLGGVTTSRAGAIQVLNDLSGFTAGIFGTNGYILFDSATLGIPVTANSMVRFETADLLLNGDILLPGKVISDVTVGPPAELRTLAAQITRLGVLNQRLNGVGYVLGSTASASQGTMTSYSENVIASVGVDGGIFVFGSGVASGTTNLVEIALIKRYGL